MTTHDHNEAARRRYEEPEMAPGSVGTATAWAVVAVCLCAVLAVPVWRLLNGSMSVAGAGLSTSSESWDDDAGLLAFDRRLLDGIHRFETNLEETSPLRGATLTSLQWFQLRFGGTGNETVYPGAKGWLLFRPGFDHLVGAPFLDARVLKERRRSADTFWRPAAQPDPRPALLDFHRQLRERGIDLVLVPVSTKPAIQRGSLAPQVPRPLENPSLGPFVAAMEDAGIHVFDIAAVLLSLAHSGTDAYLHTDSHWSPEAVVAVAEALASWLEQTYGEELGPADAFWQSTTSQRRGRGDLWRLLKLSPLRSIYDEESITIREISTWDGRLWSPSAEASVLVLGDSFVNVYSDDSLHWGRSAGFAEQLSFHLERSVDRIARNDGAGDQVRRDLARSPRRLASTRVVVYLFATRELSVGDWPLVRLAAE